MRQEFETLGDLTSSQGRLQFYTVASWFSVYIYANSTTKTANKQLMRKTFCDAVVTFFKF